MIFIDDIIHSIKEQGIIKTILILIFGFLLLIISVSGYLIEHIYNLLIGNGWKGMSL